MSRARSDLKVTASDALEFEAIQNGPAKRRRGLKWFAWVLAFIVFLGGAWFGFDDMLMRLAGENEDDIPLIRAADGPVKVRPVNPGGLQVPNRDKLIYERMQSGVPSSSDDSVVERLLPQPEKPLPKPAPDSSPPSTQPTTTLGASTAERIPPPPALPTARVPAVKDVISVKPPPPPRLKNVQPRGAPLNLRKNLERPARPAPAAIQKTPVQAMPANDSPTNAASPNVTPTPPTGESFHIQFAATRTPESAQSEWDRMRRKHLDLLGDLRLTVTKVDLGPKKGVFYRLRVGPLAHEASARTLCKELSKRKIGCLIVKPGR